MTCYAGPGPSSCIRLSRLDQSRLIGWAEPQLTGDATQTGTRIASTLRCDNGCSASGGDEG